MKKVLINFRAKGSGTSYASGTYVKSQAENSITGKEIGGFDDVSQYTLDDIDNKFKEKNKFLFKIGKGAGFWCWKPYIVLDALSKVNEGDLVFYSDSGASFVKPVQPLVDLCAQTEGVMVFRGGNHFDSREKHQTKRDTFFYMGCKGKKYEETFSRAGSFILWIKNDFSVQVAKEWLYYNQDPRCVSDFPSICGEKEVKGFREHRHDQSILSVLTKKFNIKSFLSPCQFTGQGWTTHNNPLNKYAPNFMNNLSLEKDEEVRQYNIEQSVFEKNYGMIIHHHRRRD